MNCVNLTNRAVVKHSIRHNGAATLHYLPTVDDIQKKCIAVTAGVEHIYLIESSFRSKLIKAERCLKQ